MEILLKLKPVTSLKDLVDKETRNRKIGLLYFQVLENRTGIIPRVVSEQTDREWLQQMILKGKIFVNEEKTIAEKS